MISRQIMGDLKGKHNKLDQSQQGINKMKIITGKTLFAGCIAMMMSHSLWAQEIKVAIVGAMSGPVAQYGDMEFTGARQAIADINANGGINGNKLVGVEYDDACDPKQAVAVANKVINDNIRYVIGHLCSSSTQPASDIYEDEGVIMITPAATNADLTTRGYQMILRTTGLDSDQGPTAAKYIVDKIKPQRIAIVHDKQQYGEGLARSVLDKLKKAGVNIVLFEGVTAGDKDFSALVARLKKENVDFVYFGGYYPEMGQILRQAKQAGLNIRFMGPEGVGNSSLSNIAGVASEGMLVTLPKRYDQVPVNKAIVEAIKGKKGDSTGPFVWTTYAALQSLATAMNRTGSMEPTDLVKDLKANPVDTVMGTLSWNAVGDLKGFEFGIFEWHADGSSTSVK
ncbi:L-leucine-binding protein /L-isoleucine-binding protein /L-valine-binding protein [Photorhabdus luminescens]|uniref:L-leucine-binding protein /L-isoleucine-binding protein /L-valine-binding protein n=2 Tax=Morganellaceae TaxID=1903414 RepID=A0A1G5QP35_PHOLU|nr:L-leucine-binding protein /L-isoleucine-binding protein /L-valine-binding protein [Photorhabdus luminescens]